MVLMLLAASVSAQTLGTKFPGSSVEKETWQVTIAASDSVSTYFIVPPNVDKVLVHFDLMDAGGVTFETAIDTSRVSGGFVLSDFTVLQTFGAVQDSIASTAGNVTIDITDRAKGVAAMRFHVGYNSAVTQTNAVGIYVFIRKKPPS